LSDILGIILPVFALVLLGYVGGRARWMSEAGVKGLSSFVFYLAIPALLFRTLARGEIPEALDFDIVFAYFAGAFLVMGVAWAVGRLVFANGVAELALMGMGSMYSNTVLLGIPLVYAVFGEPGILPMMMIVTFHSLILLPLTMILVEFGQAGGQTAGGARRVFLSTAASVFKNPVILSMLAGLAYNISGLALPGPVDVFAGLLGGASAPCALFALGATLAAYRIAGDLRETLVVVALKLLLHPLAVWIAATQIFALTPLWASVATLTAALPSGVNVFVIARQYDIYLARASAAVLISVGLSVLTLAALIAWLAPS
jgi:predicted permease